MNEPSHGDRFVKVSAYLSDAGFGYENWHARQFASEPCYACPPEKNHRAVLIICANEAEQKDALAFLEARAAAHQAIDGSDPQP